MSKITYTTKTDPKGNTYRYRCWVEEFKDQDSGKSVFIKRHRLIKVNGDPVKFYGNSELKRMTNKQNESIKIRLK